MVDRPTAPRNKALVIFDEAEAAKPWGDLLIRLGLEVKTANTLADAVAVWGEELPDLILLVDFNGLNEELEICRSLRQESPVPVLLLTNKGDEAFQLEAYRAGVDECIVLPVSLKLFQAKVRAWLRRTQSLPASVLDAVHLNCFRLDPQRRRLATPESASYKLTNLETRLLYVLMSHPGRTMDSVKLIERVWGSYGGGDHVMLKNVVYRLRRKLEPDPHNPSRLVTEGNGYRLVV